MRLILIKRQYFLNIFYKIIFK